MEIVIIVIVVIGLALVPAFVAWSREHPQKIPITLLTIFLGWTVIGWVGALVWSAQNFDSGRKS